MTQHAEIFEFLKRLHNECIRLSDKIRFHKRQPRHLYLVALWGTLVEFTGCLIGLIEGNHGAGVPSIFRSMLEAYVELTNLYEKGDYAYYMEASFNEQRIKLLEEAKKNPNPYLKRISQSENLEAQIKNGKTELANLKAKGFAPLKILERFERAGMVHEYRSLYTSLSNNAHSNIGALVNRHIEIHGNEFSVVYYKQKQLEDYLTYVDSATGLLVNASLKIHTFFNTDSLKDIEQLHAELGRIRAHSNRSTRLRP
jgi:Family of unknown function (DUF5677)